MITDWSIMNGMKRALIEKLPDFYEGEDVLFPLSENQIVIDEMDIDNLPAKVSIFIIPSYEENTRDTTASDQSVFNVELVFINKGLDRATLMRQAQLYKASIEALIGSDETLEGLVDFCHVESSQFYVGVDSLATAKGFKLELQFIYHKVY